MICIKKAPPPGALVTYARSPNARYDGPGFEEVKPLVRDALVREQRGICCYCMDRITASQDDMKIEHHVPQNDAAGDSARSLDWTNLLGACCGEKPPASGRGAMLVHCDSAKGGRELALNPTNAAHVAKIDYQRKGTITSTDPTHSREIEDILRLNTGPLVALRARVLEVFTEELGKGYKARALPMAKLRKLRERLADPLGEPLRPFVGILCWWLDRAIRKQATPPTP